MAMPQTSPLLERAWREKGRKLRVPDSTHRYARTGASTVEIDLIISILINDGDCCSEMLWVRAADLASHRMLNRREIQELVDPICVTDGAIYNHFSV